MSAASVLIKRSSKALQWGSPITVVYIALSSGPRRPGGQPCQKGTNLSIARIRPTVALCRHARTGGHRKKSEKLFGYARVSVASDADANNLEKQRRVLADCEQVFLETGFCAEALGDALNQATPEVFNTDQGSQFTSREFMQILQDHSVKISMDGRGRYQDNILVERLWRTVKYEEVYLTAYANGLEARNGLREYFRFYNHRRPHQALGYRTPAEVFHGGPVEEDLKERRCPDQPVLVSYGGVQESHLIVA